MVKLLTFLTLFCLGMGRASAVDGENVFTFHLFGEPYSLDPATASGASGSYLFSNIYRGLYRWSSQHGLVGEGAKVCRTKDLKVTCELNSQMKWSDGSAVTADDYVRAFRRIFDPETKSRATELLIQLKNAKNILQGQARLEDLGVKSQGPLRLIFEFESVDPEFLQKLTHPALSPLKSLPIESRERAHRLIVNGPYQIESWHKGQRVRLKNNPFYWQNIKRPPVEILMIDEDSTAMRLYENGKLSFLRRVAINDVPAYKKRSDFHEMATARFDYIGFGPELKNQRDLRKALSLSLNYSEAKALMQTGGMPGCPSLDAKYFAKYPCVTFQPNEARAALKKVPKEILDQPLIVYFSKLGGDSHQIVFEWVQNQWKKHLGLKVELRSQEQNVMTKTIQSGQAPVFRRGVGLDRPTCLAALEVFVKDNPENFIHFESEPFNKIVSQWPSLKTDRARRKACSDATALLLKDFSLIPLGVVYFSYMARPEFTGWTLNELNQLDLSQLTFSSPLPVPAAHPSPLVAPSPSTRP